jgi:Trk K+ transport system NAD-binding subunit
MKLQPNPSTTKESSDAGETPDYCVLGGGRVGEAITRRLHADGHPVTAVGETCDATGYATVRGDPALVRHLEAADIDDGSTVVVATPRDERNLLLAQLVRTHFDAARVVVRVNDPDRRDLVAEVGHEPFCVASALSEAIVDDLTRTAREAGYDA